MALALYEDIKTELHTFIGSDALGTKLAEVYQEIGIPVHAFETGHPQGLQWDIAYGGKRIASISLNQHQDLEQKYFDERLSFLESRLGSMENEFFVNGGAPQGTTRNHFAGEELELARTIRHITFADTKNRLGKVGFEAILNHAMHAHLNSSELWLVEQSLIHGREWNEKLENQAYRDGAAEMESDPKRAEVLFRNLKKARIVQEDFTLIATLDAQGASVIRKELVYRGVPPDQTEYAQQHGGSDAGAGNVALAGYINGFFRNGHYGGTKGVCAWGAAACRGPGSLGGSKQDITEIKPNVEIREYLLRR